MQVHLPAVPGARRAGRGGTALLTTLLRCCRCLFQLGLELSALQHVSSPCLRTPRQAQLRGLLNSPETLPLASVCGPPTPPGVSIETRSPRFPGVEQNFDASISVKGTCKVSRMLCVELAPRVIPQSRINALHIRKTHTKSIANLVKFSSYFNSYKLGAILQENSRRHGVRCR